MKTITLLVILAWASISGSSHAQEPEEYVLTMIYASRMVDIQFTFVSLKSCLYDGARRIKDSADQQDGWLPDEASTLGFMCERGEPVADPRRPLSPTLGAVREVPKCVAPPDECA